MIALVLNQWKFDLVGNLVTILNLDYDSSDRWFSLEYEKVFDMS